MIPPPKPVDEASRSRALENLRILDRSSDRVLNTVVEDVMRTFHAPIAGVSFVDQKKQWFIARHGLPQRETSREASFAGYTILEDKPFVVENALEDERFVDNPHVVSTPYICFYAGRSLTSKDGIRIGALSVMDTRPRNFSAHDVERLGEFAERVEKRLQEVAVGASRREAKPAEKTEGETAAAPSLLRQLAFRGDPQDREFVKELVQSYLENLPTQLRLLEDSLQAGDFSKCRRVNQLLQVSSERVEADKLSRMVSELPVQDASQKELALRQLEEIRNLSGESSSRLQSLLDELETAG